MQKRVWWENQIGADKDYGSLNKKHKVDQFDKIERDKTDRICDWLNVESEGKKELNMFPDFQTRHLVNQVAINN